MEEAVQKGEAYYRNLYRVDMGMISTDGLLTEVLRRAGGSKNMKLLLKDVRANCFSMRAHDGASTVIGDMVHFLVEVEGDCAGDGELASLEAELASAGGRGVELAERIDELRAELEPEDWTVVDLHGHCDRWGHGTLILENAQKMKIKTASDTVVIVTEKQWEL